MQWLIKNTAPISLSANYGQLQLSDPIVPRENQQNAIEDNNIA